MTIIITITITIMRIVGWNMLVSISENIHVYCRLNWSKREVDAFVIFRTNLQSGSVEG